LVHKVRFASSAKVKTEESFKEGEYIEMNVCNTWTQEECDVEKKRRCALLDSGANVSIATSDLVKILGIEVVSCDNPKRIHTASKGGFIESIGTIDVGGFVGIMHVVPQAASNLISTMMLNVLGVCVEFKSDGNCRLYDCKGEIAVIKRNVTNKMHFVDIVELSKGIRSNDCNQQLMALIAVDSSSLGGEESKRQTETKKKHEQEGKYTHKTSQEIIGAVQNLHQCLGHLNYRTLAMGIKYGVFVGTGLTYADVMAVAKRIDCVACAQAKNVKHASPTGSGIRMEFPFEVISVDRLGPYQPKAIGGYNFGIIAMDCTTLFGVVDLVPNTKAKAYISFIEKIRLLALRFHFVIRRVRFDAGSVENSNEFCAFLSTHGIEPCPAGVERQDQNPVERYVRTIKETVAAMMVDQGHLHPCFWGLCLTMAVALRNMVPNTLCPDSSPNTIVMGITTDVSYMANHYFGEMVVVRKTGYTNLKVAIGEPRNEIAIIIGVGNIRNKSWVCYRLGHKQFRPVERSDVQSLKMGDGNKLNMKLVQSLSPVVGIDNVTRFQSRAETETANNFSDVQVDLKEKLSQEDTQDGVVRIGDMMSSIMRHMPIPLPPPMKIPLPSFNVIDVLNGDETKTLEKEPTSVVGIRDAEIEPTVIDVNPEKEKRDEVALDCEQHPNEVQTETSNQDVDEKDTINVEEKIIEGTTLVQNEKDQPDVVDELGETSSSSINSGRTTRVRYPPKKFGKEEDWVKVCRLDDEELIDFLKTLDRPIVFHNSESEGNIFQMMCNVSLVEHNNGDNQESRNPSRKETRNSPSKEKWISAENEEMRMHLERGTFIECALPEKMKAIPTKWVYVIKDDGRYKARIVARGDRDFSFSGETYSPTSIKSVMWLLFSVWVILGLHSRVIDVTGAFVAEKITREVYVDVDKKIYKLGTFLYGLKDAAKEFYDRSSEHLVKNGYVRSVWDKCLFVRWIDFSRFVYVVVHVDDFMCLASTEEMLNEFEEVLKQKYKVTSKLLDNYVGITIITETDGSKVFTRPNQMERLFDQYIPKDIRLKIKCPNTPMTVEYGRLHEHNESEIKDKTKYQELLGSLIQLIDVRPDISYAVSKCAQRTTEHKLVDYKALIRIVYYLFGTKSIGIRLRPGIHGDAKVFLMLRAYCDASYASLVDGKSMYSFSFDMVPVGKDWEMIEAENSTVKQTGQFYTKTGTCPLTSLSSTDSETSAIVEAMKTVLQFRGVMKELRLQQLSPTIIFNDNQSAIQLSNKFSGNHKHCRYMMSRIGWLMDNTTSGNAIVKYMHTDELTPDMNTKSLPGPQYIYKRNKHLGYDVDKLE
jgi:hypothetical protein